MTSYQSPHNFTDTNFSELSKNFETENFVVIISSKDSFCKLNFGGSTTHTNYQCTIIIKFWEINFQSSCKICIKQNLLSLKFSLFMIMILCFDKQESLMINVFIIQGSRNR